MEAEGLDLALMVFDHTEGAERAYSNAPRVVAGIPWSQEVAFVAHHRHDRIVVNGEVAGHYVSADDEQDFMGPKTLKGAATGGLVGVLFGPLGVALGVVSGGIAGGVDQEQPGPRLHNAFLDDVRSEVPEGSSAVVLLAAPEHVDAMVAALDGRGGRLVRHHLTPEAAKALVDAIADSPAAAPPHTTT